MADLKLTVDYTQLKQANKELQATGTAAQQSARVFNQAFRKVEADQNKALKTVRDRIALSKRMEQQKAREAKAAEAASRRELQAEKELKGSLYKATLHGSVTFVHTSGFVTPNSVILSVFKSTKSPLPVSMLNRG